MGGRWTRLLLLALCSPVLVPLLCLSCPLLSLAALCLRLSSGMSRRGRVRRRRRPRPPDQEEAGAGILHQYLEDQFRLVRSVVDDEGEEDGDDDEGGLASPSSSSYSSPC